MRTWILLSALVLAIASLPSAAAVGVYEENESICFRVWNWELPVCVPDDTTVSVWNGEDGRCVEVTWGPWSLTGFYCVDVHDRCVSPSGPPQCPLDWL